MGKERVSHPTGGESRTQQQFKDAADINQIMGRSIRTGAPLRGPGPVGRTKLRFMHLSGQSYHEMLCQIQEAQGAFAGLPAKVRRRFANNPENMFRFMEDRENLPEAVQLGLVDPDTLPEEVQRDLVKDADAADYQEFREWQRKKRANAQAAEAAEKAAEEPQEGTPKKRGK